jgi:hypothetical protein
MDNIPNEPGLSTKVLQQIKIRLNVSYDIDRIDKLHYNKNK